MKRKIDKYTILIGIDLILFIGWCIFLIFMFTDLFNFTPKKSENFKESIVDTVDWLNARYVSSDIGVGQYKGEELEHLDRSQFVNITDLPYGIYIDANTNEITMNLDDVFPFVDNDADPSTVENCQERFIDKDYINKYCGDYGHHSTELFLNYFFNFDKVDNIIVGGRALKFDHYDTADAPLDTWKVFLDETGEEQHYDNRIEFLTCVYNPELYVADRRFIAYMEEFDSVESTIYEDDQGIKKNNDIIEIDVYPPEDEEIVKMNSKTHIDHPIIKFLKDNLLFVVCAVFIIIVSIFIIKKKKEEEKEKELERRGRIHLGNKY